MMIKIDENLKKILKVAVVWFFLPIIFIILYELIQGNFIQFLKEEAQYMSLALYAVYILIIFACFLPTIILLYFLCKKIKSINKRIFLIAFSIPFTNMIYFFIEIIFSINSTVTIPAGYSMTLGAIALFLLGAILVLTAITPAKWLPFKKEFLKTEALMIVLGWVLVTVSFWLSGNIIRLKGKLGLKAYQPTIEYILNYQKENGKYPASIEKEVTPSEHILPYYEYKTYNNNDGFVLKVSNNSYGDCYRYCSDEKYEGCKEGNSSEYHYEKVSGWIRQVFVD